jgi:tRNA threonylcarbamoyladenosine biosynthesis protein TsaE
MISRRTVIRLSLANEEETQKFAEAISGFIKPVAEASGLTLGLVGDLGGGKTTLSRYLCRSIGSLVPITSPTFVLCYEYQTAGSLIIEHWDLYRLNEPSLELLELPKAGVLRVVEWIDKFPELTTEAAILIRLGLRDEVARDVTLEFPALLDPDGALERRLAGTFTIIPS